MQQLLQIESIPIKLEIKSTMARFQKPEVPAADLRTSQQKPFIKAERGKGSAEPVQASSAKNAKAYPAVDEYSAVSDQSYSDMLMSELYGGSAYVGQTDTASDYIRAGIQNTIIHSQALSAATHSDFIDKKMQVYASDRSNFEISAGLGITDMEFVPGSVEFTVTQKPAVNIEYIGSPIYVPRSADPNYVDVYA